MISAAPLVSVTGATGGAGGGAGGTGGGTELFSFELCGISEFIRFLLGLLMKMVGIPGNGRGHFHSVGTKPWDEPKWH